MTESRRFSWCRAILGGLGAGLVLLAAGDGNAVPNPLPIDPLEILASEVKPNVLILFDTSSSMKWDVDTDGVPVGGDDTRSRFRNAKDALNAVLPDFSGKANFGFATFGVPDASKTLNVKQNLDGGTGGGTTDGLDGPLVYVSTDANATSWLAYFDGASDNFSAYDDTDPSKPDEIFASFMNAGPYATGYPAGCAAVVDCRFYLQSRLLRSGSKFQFDKTSSPGVKTDDFIAEVTGATTSGCIQLEEVTPGGTPVAGTLAKFCYTSGIFQAASTSCGGLLLESVPGCAAASNVSQIQTHLRRELDDANADGQPDGVSANGPDLTDGNDNPTVVGIRADQDTPDGLALSAAGGFLPAPSSFQKNFVLLITDGLTDADLTENGDCGADPNAKIASAVSQATTLFANGTETVVVAFGGTVDKNRADQIARAGSVAGSFGRDAFVAHDRLELNAAIRSALDVATNSGTFSVTQPILATVFELGGSPLDPKTRYNNRVNILYTAEFDLPGWLGHVFALRNDGSFLPVGDVNVTGRWDAGESLFELVSQKGLEATTGAQGTNRFTFSELHSGRTVRTIGDPSCAPDPGGAGVPAGCAVVQRRIFTSSPTTGTCTGTAGLNCTYSRPGGDVPEWDGARAESSNVVALWPPNQADLTSGVSDIDPPFDPTNPNTPGPLDAALGIRTLSFGQLKSQFGACDGSADNLNSGPVPAECSDTALRTGFARKEAREIILAYTAGAKLARAGLDGKPQRSLVAPFELLYRDRGWILLESTLSTPVIAAPPLRSTPARHTAEFVLFRDGRRDADRQAVQPPEIDKGWGLRNPDFDDANPEGKKDLKPVMTVVYIGGNDMLHAFRAGPSCGLSDPTLCTAAGEEQGSEELWGFVPFDQLGKLKDFVVEGQVRDPHKYVIASSMRLVDVFIPSPFTLTDPNGVRINFDGRWRTILVFGRGPGGKFYTALDVTAPGPFTRQALRTNPPFVLWNHGNEDGIGDPYDGMGQTWSVPALGNVDTSTAPLCGLGNPAEWRAWMGSGYGDLPGEGHTFYMLDAVTGNICMSRDVDVLGSGAGATTFFTDNTLVAGAAAYNPFLLDNPTQQVRSQFDSVQRVYIPDVKGRIWKFNTSSGGLLRDEGANQPFGNPVALLKVSDVARVFAESGNDSRVPLSAGPFKIFGFSDGTPGDTAIGTTPTTDVLFRLDLVDASSGNRFRGTVQPATAFNEEGAGRVFFAGTRSFASPTVACASEFDTILFAVTALSGSAAYDFNGGGADLSTIIQNSKATSVQTAGGQLLIGESGGPGTPPPTPVPPPAALQGPAPAAHAAVTTLAIRPSSAVCRQ